MGSVSPYVVRYHTALEGDYGSVYVMAKSAADAEAQVRNCSPSLRISTVEPHREDMLHSVGLELQLAGRELHEASEAMHGKGLHMAQGRAARASQRALVAAGVVLGG